MHLKRCSLAAVLLLSVSASFLPAAPLEREQIIAEAEKVADAQLHAFTGKKINSEWVDAVMQAGLADFSHVSSKGETYIRTLTALADKDAWSPGTASGKKDLFHADDLCIAQTYLDLYVDRPEPAHLAPVKARLDLLAEHLNADVKPGKKTTWWWCDSLFMAPPALARLSAITGDRKYLDAMDKEYWRTVALLYDPEEKLFYRDDRFLHEVDKAGKKIFWSRGNGWVSGGLVRILQYMPADYPSRPKYVELYKNMMAAIAPLQSEDGTWHSSLLDPNLYPQAETSGTAFFVYAMAWGINNKLLDAEKYELHLTKGWTAVLADRRSDGLPGNVQAVASQPGATKPDGTQPYTTGAILMAAVELQKLAANKSAQSSNSGHVIYADQAPASPTKPPPPEPPAGTIAYARYVPERMDDIAWENDRIAHRIYGPALQNNPKEHSGSGIDVWVKSVRNLVINEWYRSGKYHVDRGTGLDLYEVGTSRGDGGLGIWDNGKLYVSKDWTDFKILDKGLNECGFDLTYAPWQIGADENARKVWEHRTMCLKAGSNLDRIESTIDSDKPGELVVGIGLAKRTGPGGHLFQDKDRGILSYWQPPEKNGTIGVGVIVDPASIVSFTEDPLNYLVLVKATAGKPFVYYAGACWDRGLDFHTADQWEQYLREFKRE